MKAFIFVAVLLATFLSLSCLATSESASRALLKKHAKEVISDVGLADSKDFEDSLELYPAPTGMFLSNTVSPKVFFERCFLGAKENITAAVYKFSDEDVYEALRASIKKTQSLRVRIVINDDTLSHDHKKWLKKLKDEGDNVEIRFWKKHGDTFNKLHAKFTLCDNFAVVGSPNWSKSSNEGENLEIVQISRDKGTADRLRLLFDSVWNDKHAHEE